MATEFRILIRSAAGPRIGYGHLVRARTLVRALPAEVSVSVRGGREAVACAKRLGLTLAPSSVADALRAVRPALLVIDDPSEARARRALGSARAAGVPVASIHDLGVARIESDLVIDGSIAPAAGGAGACAGPRFAVLDPALLAGGPAKAGRPTSRPCVLVALGGGPRASLAALVARAVAGRVPGVQVRVAGGLQRVGRSAAETPPPGPRAITWLGPLPTLAAELRACDAAVLAGGVTLYEACALGVPVVALPVVAAQQKTVEAFARRRAALLAPLPGRSRGTAAAVAANHVAALLASPRRLRRQAGAAQALVDGGGTRRVVRALVRLARAARETSPGDQSSGRSACAR